VPPLLALKTLCAASVTVASDVALTGSQPGPKLTPLNDESACLLFHLRKKDVRKRCGLRAATQEKSVLEHKRKAVCIPRPP
jgi:hypothetical protein